MTESDTSYIGAIEGGGTKFLCAVGTGANNIVDRVEIATRYPDETISDIAKFFSQHCAQLGSLEAVGVGCFGPMDIETSSPSFGRILETQKPGWSGFDLYSALRDAVSAPISLDTDVNTALMGEVALGAAKGLQNCIYITIGTGIGAGVISQGAVVYGRSHTEIGCTFIPKAPQDTHFRGVCPFHDDQCAEGLASGPAMEARWGVPGDQLPEDHEAWDLEAHYIAILCHNLIMAYAPEKIILGGGVMKQAHLFPKIRNKVKEIDKRFVEQTENPLDVDLLICPPELQGASGLIGAMVLAERQRSLAASVDHSSVHA